MILTALNSQITKIERKNNIISLQGNYVNRENAQTRAVINPRLLRVYFASSSAIQEVDPTKPVYVIDSARIPNPPKVERGDTPLIDPNLINNALQEAQKVSGALVTIKNSYLYKGNGKLGKQMNEALGNMLNLVPSDKLATLINPNTKGKKDIYVAAFNPAATPAAITSDGEGGVHFLVRCTRGNYPHPKEGEKFISDLWYLHSKDGKTIDKESIYPVFLPSEEFPWGYEDPRITKIPGENKYYIVSTAYDGKVARTVGFETKDFINFPPIGADPNDKNPPVAVIGPSVDYAEKWYQDNPEKLEKQKHLIAEDKDTFFYPEKVSGKLMFFHRFAGDIQAVFAKDVNDLKSSDFWKEQLSEEKLKETTILRHIPGTWEAKLGGGAPPLKVRVKESGGEKEYVIMMYHSSSKNNDPNNIMKRTYYGGIALLDSKDPTRVIARSPKPIMTPEKDYEKNGYLMHVFPQGLAVKHKDDDVDFSENKPVEEGDKLLIYYGAADKYCGVGEVDIKQLIDYTKQFDAKWWEDNTDYDIKGNPRNKES